MERISVIGFGKIGQAVAANILVKGISVTAIDINPELLEIFKNVLQFRIYINSCYGNALLQDICCYCLSYFSKTNYGNSLHGIIKPFISKDKKYLFT